MKWRVDWKRRVRLSVCRSCLQSGVDYNEMTLKNLHVA